MDCGRCGLYFESADGFYLDGEDHKCGGCGTTNTVFVDEVEDDGTEVYVGSWWCVHGGRSDQECKKCDQEDQAESSTEVSS